VLVRWLTRHRVGVTAVGAAVLVALAGAAVVLGVQARANIVLRSANLELEVANAKVTQANKDLAASNERERARFALAQDAIRTFHSGVSEDILLKEEQFKALRTKLLRGAREFYRKLEELLKGHEDRDSRLALGTAYLEVGELTRQLDAFAEAPEVIQRAVALFERLSDESPADPEPRRSLALALRALGTVVAGVGRDESALLLFNRSRDLFRTLSEAAPSDDQMRIEWAEAELYRVSSLAANKRPPGEQLEAAEQARSILNVRTGAEPPSSAMQIALMDVYSALASALEDVGRHHEALASFARACELGESLYRASPSDPNLGHELARNLGNMGLCLVGIGRRDEALDDYNRGLEVLKEVTASNPTVVRLPAASAWINGLVAETLSDLGRNDEALQSFERAVSARETLIKANPTVVRNHEQLQRSYSKVAEIHRRAKRMPQAVAALKALVKTSETIVQLVPNNQDQTRYLASNWADLAGAHAAMGSVTEALSCFDEAIAIERQLIAADPSTPTNRSELASTLRGHGIAMEQMGQIAKSVSDYRQAIASMHEIEKPTDWDRYNMACYQSLLSGALSKMGAEPAAAESRAAADQAIISLLSAIGAGWRDFAKLKTDTDIDPIRSRPDFQPILLDAGFPLNPFAR
jgi:tetratricopeptide (TPR) repeat protein